MSAPHPLGLLMFPIQGVLPLCQQLLLSRSREELEELEGEMGELEELEGELEELATSMNLTELHSGKEEENKTAICQLQGFQVRTAL